MFSYFLYLISYLPNLKALDFTVCSYHEYYLNILVDADVQLQQIEEIQKSTIFADRFIQSYFLVCYKFRHTLTHLSLSHLSYMYSIDGQYGNYLYFLPDFKNLTHVSISQDDADENAFTLFLELCPNLISLNFTENYYNSSTMVPAAHSNSYGRQLKFLVLCLSVFTTAYISYLTYYPLDTKLDTLHVSMIHEDLSDWLDSNTQDDITAFATRASSINDIKLRFTNMTEQQGSHR